jgi:hypothetical protein
MLISGRVSIFCGLNGSSGRSWGGIPGDWDGFLIRKEATLEKLNFLEEREMEGSLRIEDSFLESSLAKD